MIDERVQRRGLPASGGAHQEHEPGWSLQHDLGELLERLGLESDLVYRNDSLVAIENAHHDRFAERGDVRRHANVAVPAIDADVNLPVLMVTLLRDVESGEDLHTGGDTGPEVDGQVGKLVQDTVDPDSNTDPAERRLDVQVAGIELNGPREQVVHQLDRLFAALVTARLGSVQNVVVDLELLLIRRLAPESLERPQGLGDLGAR